MYIRIAERYILEKKKQDIFCICYSRDLFACKGFNISISHTPVNVK